MALKKNYAAKELDTHFEILYNGDKKPFKVLKDALNEDAMNDIRGHLVEDFGTKSKPWSNLYIKRADGGEIPESNTEEITQQMLNADLQKQAMEEAADEKEEEKEEEDDSGEGAGKAASAVADYAPALLALLADGGYVVTRSNDRKGKTHKVTNKKTGEVRYFGDSELGQHPKDKGRREAFYARHAKNLASNPFFRAFAHATWKAQGGMIADQSDMAAIQKQVYPDDERPQLAMLSDGGLPETNAFFRAANVRHLVDGDILSEPEGEIDPDTGEIIQDTQLFPAQQPRPDEMAPMSDTPKPLLPAAPTPAAPVMPPVAEPPVAPVAVETPKEATVKAAAAGAVEGAAKAEPVGAAGDIPTPEQALEEAYKIDEKRKAAGMPPLYNLPPREAPKAPAAEPVKPEAPEEAPPSFSEQQFQAALDTATAQKTYADSLPDGTPAEQSIKIGELRKADAAFRQARFMHAHTTGESAQQKFDQLAADQVTALRQAGDIAAREAKIQAAFEAKQALILQQEQERFQTKLAQYQAAGDRIRESIEKQQIDPDRYLKNVGKIGFGISAILGVIGSAFGSKQSVAEYTDRQIERDLQAQMKELDRKKGVLSSYIEAGKSFTDAYKLARADMKDALAAQLSVQLSGIKDEKAKNVLAQAIAKARMDAAKAREQVAKAEVEVELLPEKLMAQFAKATGQADNSLARERFEETKAENQRRADRFSRTAGQRDVALGQGQKRLEVAGVAEGRKGEAAAGGKPAQQEFKAGYPITTVAAGKLPKEEAELVVNHPTKKGIVLAAKTKADADKVKEAEKLSITAKKTVKRLEEIFTAAGGTIPIGATGKNAELRAEAVALQEGLLSSLTKLLETGTINQGDYGRLKTFIPSIDDWSRDKTIAGKFKGFNSVLDTGREAGLTVFLRNPESINMSAAPSSFKPERAVNPVTGEIVGEEKAPAAEVGKKRTVKRTP